MDLETYMPAYRYYHNLHTQYLESKYTVIIIISMIQGN